MGALVFTHELKTDPPSSSPAIAGHPGSLLQRRALPGTLPAVPELCAGPGCGGGFVPAQHIGVRAPSSRQQPHS